MNPLPLLVALKRDFWGLFGAIWLVGGLLMLIIGVPLGIRGEGYVIAVAGLLVAVLGGRLLRAALKRVALEERLRREGLSAQAEVTGVERTQFRYNRQFQWVIVYRFTDRMEAEHTGRSGYLDPDEAAEWKAGDQGVVRFDPKHPEHSIWIGKA